MVQEPRIQASETFKYRAILLTAIVVYPCWTVITNYFSPQLQEFQQLRMSMAAFASIILGFSYLIPKNKIHIFKFIMVATAFIAFAHASWFLYLTNSPYIEYCGYIILMSTLLAFMPNRASVFLIAISALTFTAVLSQVDRNWEMPAEFLPVGMIVTLIPALLSALTRLDQLATIQRSQQQQTILFSNMEEGIISFNMNGIIESINPAALRLLKANFNDLKNLPSQNARLFDLGFLAMSSGKAIRNQSISISTNGSPIRWLNVNAITYQASKTEFKALLTFSDITSMKESQELILQQQAQLFSTAKLSSLGEMAAGIAHEINNPLAIISGRLEIASREFEIGNPVKAADDIKKAHDVIPRIRNIISGLQTFSRGGDHELSQMANVSKMVNEVISFCRERIQNLEVKIELQIDSQLTIECRPGQIEQVLLNLIHNSTDALKYSQDKWIKITATSVVDHIQIAISDSGTGIKTELAQKIMEPFFTTKDIGKGTGLGLSISRGIINAHSGQLRLLKNSDPTTFVIELPILQSKTHSSIA